MIIWKMKILGINLKLCRNIQISLFLIQVMIITLLIYFRFNYVINVTPSLPRGIYKLEKPKNLKIGDIVLFDIEKDIKKIMADRGYIPNQNIKLLKTIGAFEYSNIEVKNNILYIDNQNYGKILEYDLEGRKLNKIDIKVEKGYFLALTKKNLSYDSRYFGQVRLEKIQKKAKLVYKFKE